MRRLPMDGGKIPCPHADWEAAVPRFARASRAGSSGTPSFFGKANSNDMRLISRMATALALFSPMDGGPDKKRIARLGMEVTGPG